MLTHVDTGKPYKMTPFYEERLVEQLELIDGWLEASMERIMEKEPKESTWLYKMLPPRAKTMTGLELAARLREVVQILIDRIDSPKAWKLNSTAEEMVFLWAAELAKDWLTDDPTSMKRHKDILDHVMEESDVDMMYDLSADGAEDQMVGGEALKFRNWFIPFLVEQELPKSERVF